MCTWIWKIKPEKQQDFFISLRFNSFLTYHIEKRWRSKLYPRKKRGWLFWGVPTPHRVGIGQVPFGFHWFGWGFLVSRWDGCYIEETVFCRVGKPQLSRNLSIQLYTGTYTRTPIHTYIFYITFHFISLRYIPFHSTPLHCIALHYVTLHYITYIQCIYIYIHIYMYICIYVYVYVYVYACYIIIYPYYTHVFFAVVATSSFLWFLHSWQVYARLQLRFSEGQKELPQLLHGIFGFYADAWMLGPWFHVPSGYVKIAIEHGYL